MQPRTKIAFLGLGAMGRRMAHRLSDAGFELAVWSRSGHAASAPPRARSASTIRDAVAGAEVVFSMVRDDAASRAVWLGAEGALATMQVGAVAVECSTLSPAWVTELCGAARRAGALFLDAPVVGSRPQAEAGSLIFLAGGTPDALERVRPVLSVLGSAVHQVGASPAGAYAKLMVNTLFGIQVAAVAELFGVAEKAGMDLGVLHHALEGLPVLSPSARAAAAVMIAGRFEPMFPIELVSKDLHYARAAAEALGCRAPLGESASTVFDSAVAAGLQGENITAVSKLYR